jgi:hypothetical protein
MGQVKADNRVVALDPDIRDRRVAGPGLDQVMPGTAVDLIGAGPPGRRQWAPSDALDQTASATFWPFGLPRPVQASQPGEAAKLPLLPCVMSRRAPGWL